MAQQPLLSGDGSHTLESERFGVTYHSHHGAIQETQIVFIEAGMHHAIERASDVVRIFEMGFGTGLNAVMTYIESARQEVPVDYHTIEAYPIDLDTVHKLNFQDVLQYPDPVQKDFIRMHESLNGEAVTISEQFSFTKYIQLLEELKLPDDHFDAVYFDAFAPNAQEELWDETIMSKMYDSLQIGGCLVTYCAKGSFKRTLKSVGFTLESLPGPKGKREMTRAIK